MAADDAQQPQPGYGKIAKTQLSTGDPEIVREEIVKGSAPYVQMLKMMTECETRAACSRAAHGAQTKGGGKAANQTAVLNDAARLYLNEKYRPALMSGNACKMDDAQMAQTVNLQAYRAELVQLAEDYQRKGLKIEKECVDTLLTSLDKKQLLQLAELNRIFEVLGNEAEVPRAQAHEMVDDMVKDNVLTADEAAAVKKQLTAEKIKLAQIAKLTEPYVVLRGDGTVGSKNAPAKATTSVTAKAPAKSTGGGAVIGSSGFRVPRAVGCYQPVGRSSPQFRPRALKGYASGPSRPVIQNYAVNYREAAVSADLK